MVKPEKMADLEETLMEAKEVLFPGVSSLPEIRLPLPP